MQRTNLEAYAANSTVGGTSSSSLSGTGKTTLCRAFLDGLDETTVAAYIFNPMLGPKQLLKTLNDEFGITSDADNSKELIDKLNVFLLQKKAEKKKVIVVIDEAQNLSRTVLEQLRLLEAGIGIGTFEVSGDFLSVDTAPQLEQARAMAARMDGAPPD